MRCCARAGTDGSLAPKRCAPDPPRGGLELQPRHGGAACRSVQAEQQQAAHAKDRKRQQDEQLRQEVGAAGVCMCGPAGITPHTGPLHAHPAVQISVHAVCVMPLRARLARQILEQEEQAEQAAALAARAAAVQALANMVAEPAELWAAAVQLVTAHTSASGVQCFADMLDCAHTRAPSTDTCVPLVCPAHMRACAHANLDSCLHCDHRGPGAARLGPARWRPRG